MFDILERKEDTHEFVDSRLRSRYEGIKRMLEKGQSSILNQLSINRAERKGSYDFFQNKRVEESHIKSSIYDSIAIEEIEGANLLVIQDTTEYNYGQSNQRLKDRQGLGDIGNKYGLGYFVHPSLVIEENTKSLVGLSDIQLWHREEDRAKASSRKQRDFSEKESYKWHVGIINSQKRLASASRITYIQDRDGDIYESIEEVKQLASAELLVRCCRNRRIELKDGKKSMLYKHLSNQAVNFSYKLAIRGDKRKNRSSRIAQLEVRSVRVKLVCPENLKKIAEPTIEVDVVWVREKETSVPKGETAIDWKLITTHKPHANEEAMKQLIEWYVGRWKIEEFFLSPKLEPTIWKMLYWKQDMVYEN